MHSKLHTKYCCRHSSCCSAHCGCMQFERQFLQFFSKLGTGKIHPALCRATGIIRGFLRFQFQYCNALLQGSTIRSLPLTPSLEATCHYKMLLARFQILQDGCTTTYARGWQSPTICNGGSQASIWSQA